ncbi:hypothetical protein LJC49_08400 [Ruminococcaceae bacterium OttesenSCG-928-I18]|nr:hypothetical protein [Ruminococcaceae bacterium OttesenSCG-928-I18]
MMQIWKYLLPIAGFFVLLGVVFYFINPYAPLLLLGSLIIQAPIIYYISWYSYNTAYSERQAKRKQKFEQDRDAESWFQEEKREAGSLGFKLLSAKAKSQSALLRAWLAVELSLYEEAEDFLTDVNIEKLDDEDNNRYYVVVGVLEKREGLKEKSEDHAMT